MNEESSPFDVGLDWTIKLGKTRFIGQEALRNQKAAGPSKQLTAFLLTEAGIARNGMEIVQGKTPIGHVTSGSYLPSLNASGGLALIDLKLYKEGIPLAVIVRDNKKQIQLVKKPLYQPRTK